MRTARRSWRRSGRKWSSGRSPRAPTNFAVIPGREQQPNLLFLKVPEDKTAKNRVYLDLDVDELSAARARLEGAGAQFVYEKDEWGVHWLTFLDPEGNEFCIAAH